MPNAESRMPLILYSRDGCHLCEDFEQELRRLQDDWGFEIEVRDVDTDPAWARAFGDKVPLLLGQDTEISRYFLDLAGLRRYLGRA